jgi:peptide/nickel transport system substrate-binding protein
MRPTRFLFLAVASVAAVTSILFAATRPRYGGVLRVEMRAAVQDLDPAATAPESDARTARARLLPLVYETLVRFDEEGRTEPLLAISWQADSRLQRWEFRLRPGVKFHDGTALTPAAAVAALSAAGRGWQVTEAKDAVVIESERPAPELPRDLANPALAIVLRGADGALSGTGPFRIATWEAGRRAHFAANEDYWGGRPFLDGIHVEMGRNPRDQLLDLDLDKADFVELPPQETRRASTRPAMVWSSAPIELVALVFEGGRSSSVDIKTRKALALAIDRAAIHTVLLQRRGDAAESLLPGWLSGYAFLFSSAREPGPAPRSAGSVPSGAVPLELSFDAADPLARVIAERIAVDSRAAGMAIQLSGKSGAAKAGMSELRFVRMKIRPATAATALAELQAGLGLGDYRPERAPESIQTAYEVERSLLEDCVVIPLLHLPEVYAVSQRVRSWNTPAVLRTGEWRFEDVWLFPEKS